MTIDELNEWLEYKIRFTQALIDKSKEQGNDFWKAFVVQKKTLEEVMVEVNKDNKLVS